MIRLTCQNDIGVIDHITVEEGNSYSLADLCSIMKIINANTEIPGMNREEVDRVLDSKLNLQLATIDEMGHPNIQPVWFDHDKDKRKLIILTGGTAKKTQNIRKNSNIYFSVDDCNIPYKGVKGKGVATIVEDPRIVMLTAEKIGLKYYGTLDHPGAKAITERSKTSDAVVIEINPKFFSTWDFGKKQS
jgi:general stress protein 26